jgi:hypothetical protein
MSIKSIANTLVFCWRFGATVQSRLILSLLVLYNSLWLRIPFLKKKVITNQTPITCTCFLPKLGTVTFRYQDVSILVEMFRDEAYKIPLLKQSHAEPNKIVIVDLGANIGLATLYFATKLECTTRFIVVEPFPENLDLLEKNVSQANIDAQILRGALV